MVHSTAIAVVSEHFRALVNGGLKEAETRTAELNDIELEDFACFLEYAYSRNYTVPSWVLDESIQAKDSVKQGSEPVPGAPSSPPAQVTHSGRGLFDSIPVPDTPAPPLANPRVGLPVRTISKKKKKRVPLLPKDPPLHLAALRSKFQRRYLDNTPAPSAHLLAGFEPVSNNASNQDFTPIFLAHARLYTFADIRLIHPLKELALYKLH